MTGNGGGEREMKRMSEQATALVVWGLVAHLVGDWFLQNEWMALNKVSLRHPASWVHAVINGVALAAVFPVPVAAGLGFSHLAIDTRKPLMVWRRLYRQTTQGPVFIPFAMWQDQAAHLLCIALAAALIGQRRRQEG